MFSDRLFQRIAGNTPMDFPSSAFELSGYLNYLHTWAPIRLTTSATDYELNIRLQSAFDVPSDRLIYDGFVQDDWEVEWVRYGIRMSHFYEGWKVIHPDTPLTREMFAKAGVPFPTIPAPPLKNVDFIMNIDSKEGIEHFHQGYAPKLATVTASFLFVHQVFRYHAWPFPAECPAPYLKEPDFSIEYKGPIPIRIRHEAGLPIYIAKDPVVINQFVIARRTYANLMARCSPVMQDWFKDHASTRELEFFQQERFKIEAELLEDTI